jgi:hypothetical protein
MSETQQPQVAFDRPDQLKQIQTGLMAGEQLLAVYDAIGTATGFIALTDKRVIMQNKSYLSVNKKVALISMPYNRIATVGVLSDQKWSGNWFSTSEILITSVSGEHHEVSFRGSDKAKYVHDMVLYHITKDVPR